MKTKRNGVVSETEINHGVPRGTVLNPLILLLYANDFSQNVKTTEQLVQSVDICIWTGENVLTQTRRKTS